MFISGIIDDEFRRILLINVEKDGSLDELWEETAKNKQKNNNTTKRV